MEAKDFLVETANPEALDRTLSTIGAVLVCPPGSTYVMRDGYYVMRALVNPDFVKFACESQGYCRIIRELDELV